MASVGTMPIMDLRSIKDCGILSRVAGIRKTQNTKSRMNIRAVSNILLDHQMDLFLTDRAFYVAIATSSSSFQPGRVEL